MQQLQKQALRLRRAILANLGLFLNVFLCLLAAQLGYFIIDAQLVFLLVTGMWLGHLCLVLVIYFSKNLTFQDASLTLVQMLWVIIGLSLLMTVMQEIRPLVLMGYLLVMLFGTFRLGLKEIYAVTVFTLFCYLVSLCVIYLQRPVDIQVTQEFFIFCGFAFVLTGFVFMAIEFNYLRNNLGQRHRELKGALARISDLAIKDELTGLYNRRHLLEMLAQQRALANRSQYRFVVCYLDLDHFKKVNDQYGHPFGDRVLTAFARLIDASLREVDIGARMGGEEFVLILTDTDLNAAYGVCQRIQEKWSQQSFSGAQLPPLTLSAGIAEFNVPESVGLLLGRADKLLYQAKNSGRNCIVMEQPGAQVPFNFEEA